MGLRGSGTDMSADARRVEAVADVEVAVEAEVGASEVEVQLRAGHKQGEGEEKGQGKGARGCADEMAARWLCPVAPSRYSLLLPLTRQLFPLPPFPPLDSLLRRHAASLDRWLVECLKRPLCSLWLLCKLNKSSLECKRTDSSATNTATTHSHTHTPIQSHTLSVTHSHRACKKRQRCEPASIE